MFEYHEDCIYMKNDQNQVIARIEFPSVSDRLVDIQHTIVEPAYNGQGLAGQIMKELAEWLRSKEKQAVLTCTYAQAWFPKHPEYTDVVCPLK